LFEFFLIYFATTVDINRLQQHLGFYRCQPYPDSCTERTLTQSQSLPKSASSPKRIAGETKGR
jgi:hypothetical protein